MVHGKSVILGVVIGLVVGLILPFRLADLLSQQQQSAYTEVTVYEWKPSDVIKFGEDEYVFSYSPASQYVGAKFSVTTKWLNMGLYNATEGAVYRDFGIEIVVSEVHTDYIILLVKPTYPQ